MAKKRKQFTDEDIANLPIKKKRYAEPDSDQRGLYIRVTPKGVKSFVAVAVGLDGKQVWQTIGHAGIMTVEKAREEARRIVGAIKSGADTAGPQSFAAVAEEWLKRHVERKDRKLRSAPAKRGHLNNHILPAWAGREFTSIRRADVIRLLDAVEENAGVIAANSVLDTVSGICHWYAIRNESYALPIVKGMRRSSSKERARERILSDAELRAVWKAAEANGVFGAFVRLALLTAQRKEKVASMRWSDVSIDGVWDIPAEPREKSHAGKLPLPEIALDIIKAQPRFAGNPYVLAGKGTGHLNAFSRDKKAFDAKISATTGVELPHWTVHDLRRTARSLMSRAAVDFHIAERTLGHSIKGVASVYDRHNYTEQKARALKALAGLLATILNPGDNVVSIREGG
jgi:integrase